MTRWSSPRTGRVWLDSWAGRTSILVQVLGETPKRYRVAWLESRLGRVAGGQALVPKDAVTIPGLREGDAALAALARVKGGELGEGWDEPYAHRDPGNARPARTARKAKGER